MAKGGRRDSQERPKLAGAFCAALAKAGKSLDDFKDELPQVEKSTTEKETPPTHHEWESLKKSTAPLSKKHQRISSGSVHKAGGTAGHKHHQEGACATDMGAMAKGLPDTHKRVTQPAASRRDAKSRSGKIRVQVPGEQGLFDEYYPAFPFKYPLPPGAGTVNKVKPVPNNALQQHAFEISKAGQLIPNRARFTKGETRPREIPRHSGIEANIPGAKDDASDLIIGLDFGTSCVKVVLHDRDRGGGVFYAVPFYPIGGSNPYIFPSRVYQSAQRYALDQGDIPYADLKLPLMEKCVDRSQVRHAIVFLALIIRHARGWLFSNHGDTYRNSDIQWAMNLGLPAKYAEDYELTGRFEQIALAAINLAGDTTPHLTDDLANLYLDLAEQALAGDKSVFSLDERQLVGADMVNVYPEIGAQVVAFVESESWDARARPFITLIDIGAGTVDVAFFSVERQRSQRTFRFFQSSVEPNGVMNLHRKRTTWLKGELAKKNWLTSPIREFLDEISAATDQLLGIPEQVTEYLQNFCVEGYSVDTKHFDAYDRQVNSLLHYTKNNRLPKAEDKFKNLPVILCGGGSRMQFYKKVVNVLNDFRPNSHWLHVEQEFLTKPGNLRADGLPAQEYDRLLVAYGLSFEKPGDMIPSHAIEDDRRADFPIRERPVDPTDDG